MADNNKMADLLFVQTQYTTSAPSLSAVGTPEDRPVKATGIQRAIQRYINLLLTDPGTVEGDSDIGTPLSAAMNHTSAVTEDTLRYLFAISNDEVVTTMRHDDTIGLYGDIPEEEMVDSVNLIDLYIDDLGEVTILLEFTNRAGTTVEVGIPGGE